MKAALVFAGSGPLVVHLRMVRRGVYASDDLRLFDFDEQRAFRRFHFSQLGTPILCEGEAEAG